METTKTYATVRKHTCPEAHIANKDPKVQSEYEIWTARFAHEQHYDSDTHNS